MLRQIGGVGASLYRQSRSALDEALCLCRLARRFGHLPPELSEDGDRWHEGTSVFPTPVVLVHGAAHNGSAWTALAESLRTAGFGRLVALDYRLDRGPVEELAVDLERRLRTVLDRSGTDRVHVIGHSLGGVLLRVWHDALGGARHTDAAVTLGSPHRGSWLCGLPWTPAPFRCLRPGSDLLHYLDTLHVDHSAWTTITAAADSVVLDASLPGAPNVVVHGVGHTGLLYSRAVAGQVCFALLAAEECRTEAGAGPAGVAA